MTWPTIAALAIVVLGVANAATIAAFALDKRAARRGDWRIAESTLLTLALVGGSPGALWSRRRFVTRPASSPSPPSSI